MDPPQTSNLEPHLPRVGLSASEASLLGPDASHLAHIDEIRHSIRAQHQPSRPATPPSQTSASRDTNTMAKDPSRVASVGDISSRTASCAVIAPQTALEPVTVSTNPLGAESEELLPPLTVAVETAAPRTFLSPLLADQLRQVTTTSQNQVGDASLRRKRRTLSGTIRRRVSSVLKMAGINILNDDDNESERVKGLWEIFDVDGDGIIDYAEFCRYTCDLIEMQKKKKTQAAMTSIEAKFARIVILEIMEWGTLQRAIESVFRMLDLNHSGKISQLEFEDGIRALGIMDFNYDVHGHKRRFADNSLFILPVGNRFRFCVVWLVEWKWFDRFILACIVANSVMLAFRDFQDPGSIPDALGRINLSVGNRVLDQAEAVFSWIFVVECGLKIVAMGLVFGRGAYLRSHWNMLDFFVVVIGLISDLPGVPKISSLRTARVLRPLRTLSNLRRMRMLVYALFSAIPALFNVMVILAFVFTVFGILGLLFWNGILYNRCRTTFAPVDGVWALAGPGRLCGGAYQCPAGQYCGSIYAPPEGTFVNLDALSPADKWDYAVTGFDHIGAAMLTLFQCITLEGWTAVMYNMQDAHDYVFATAYFVVFTVIGAFFLLQFVFAVIWERFNAANDGTAGEWDLILEERRASARLSAGELSVAPIANDVEKRKNTLKKRSSFSQNIKASVRSGIVVVKRNNPVRRIRSLCRKLVTSNAFCNFIVVCILLNTLTLAMDEYPIQPTRDAIAEVVNMCLTVVFSVEMVLKFAGLGWREYRSDRLNVFDGFIVCISLAELVMEVFMTSSNSSTGLSALRSFRLFRIMKLARSWKSLRELLHTIGNSLADVANFGLLLLLLMYVFALIGMQFFANKFRFDAAGEHVEWQPHVYFTTTPPHAPWTPERPYTISRSNFDDSVAAFTTVFQCLTEENWISVMADGVRSSGWGAVAYFLLVMVIGNIIILNLFLAILLGNFSINEENEDTVAKIVQGERQLETVSHLSRKSGSVVPIQEARHAPSASTDDAGSTKPRTEKRRRRRRNHSARSVDSGGRNSIDRQSGGRQGDDPAVENSEPATPHSSSRSVKKTGPTDRSQDHNPMSSSSSSDDTAATVVVASRHASGNPRHISLLRVSGRHSTPAAQIQFATPATSSSPGIVIVTDLDRSLGLFSKRSAVRRFCRAIMGHSVFEGLVLTVIVVSSIQLGMDNPLNDPASDLSITLGTLDTVFTSIFFIEMVLKVIDAGFLFNGKTSYLRDPWNMLDLCILTCSSITMFSSNTTLRSLRSLRTLRALRPLRMISRVPGMRRVVNALLSSIPCILNVFLVCSLIFLVFGIIGVNLFKGRMYYCDMSLFSDDKMVALENEFGFTSLSFRKLFSEQDCLDHGGTWSLRERNYDNVLKSAMTLFELSTTEGWIEVMFQGVDATEIGFHPVQNYNRGYIAFFIVFIIIGSFFTMNLFVGAVIDNFNRMRDSLSHFEAENDTQREWLQIQETVRATRLAPTKTEPTNRLRKFCFRLQQHPKFEALIAASVMGNTIMLAITHFGQSETTAAVLSGGNIFFWSVFFVEAIVKLMSLGVSYFGNGWNLFDFAVVCGSTVSTVLPFFTDGKISPVANTLRAFRMGLAIRLMKRAKSMQDIVNTILDNLPALVNVSTLLFLIMFVYAVIGVQLFAGVMLGENLDEHANFQSIGVGMVTLFRFATGEAWNDVMYDLMVQPISGSLEFPYGRSCVKEFTYTQLVAARIFTGDPRLTIGCSPSPTVTYMYFLTYQLLASYVLLNLFVAVILEGFEETTEKNASSVTKSDLVAVSALWEKYDPLATGYISDHEFLKFLREVQPPLGLPKPTRRRDLEQFAKQLDLFLQPNGKIGFNAFILSATQALMFRIARERGEAILPARSAASFFAKSQGFVRKVALSRRRGSSATAVPSLFVILSVKRIQAAARSRLARKRYLELKQELAARRISFYDQAAMGNFKYDQATEDNERARAITPVAEDDPSPVHEDDHGDDDTPLEPSADTASASANKQQEKESSIDAAEAGTSSI